jgi:hypothetical protein
MYHMEEERDQVTFLPDGIAIVVPVLPLQEEILIFQAEEIQKIAEEIFQEAHLHQWIHAGLSQPVEARSNQSIRPTEG